MSAFAAVVEKWASDPVAKPDFDPSHILVINQDAYAAGVEARVSEESDEALEKLKAEPARADPDAIAREVMIAVTLEGELTFRMFG